MRVAAACLLVLLAAAAPAAAQRPGDERFDARARERAAVEATGDGSARTPTRRMRRERRALERSLGRQGVLDVDALTGTPRVLARLDGTLTGPSPGDAVSIAQGYVRSNVAALGLTPADLGSLGGLERVPVGDGGAVQVRWRQYHDGIPAFDNELRVTVTADGEVLNVLGSPHHDLEPARPEPRLGAADALRAAGAGSAPPVTSGPAGARRETRFEGGAEASLVIFGEGDGARLAWRVVYDQSDVVVDAATGAVLRRVGRVRHLDPVDVFERHPGAAPAVPSDFEAEGWLDVGATTLAGPNAQVWANVDGDDDTNPDPGEQVDLMGPDFSPFSHPSGGCAPTTPCSWNHDVSSSWTTNREQTARQAFHYVNTFHDWLAEEADFTTASGAFEGADRLVVRTLQGADAVNGLPNFVNNASMTTPPDGQSPIMTLYLFSAEWGVHRDVNSGDDAAIVYHEYTHGFTDRVVVHGTGSFALTGPQGDAMAEAFSDYYAFDYLVAQGHEDDTAAVGELDLGAYTDQVAGVSRYQPLDCAVGAAACPAPSGDAGAGGFTLGDFGRIHTTAEPHADGEIWAQTLWDVRQRVGAEVARAIVAAALRVVPVGAVGPSFLDMRDAMLLAEQTVPGDHHVGLWKAFAARGMGFGASFDDGQPRESFALPPGSLPSGGLGAAPSTALTGQAVGFDATGITGGGLPNTSYAWDFGDGTGIAPGAAGRVGHAYGAPGTYRVTATVANAWGTGTGTATATVTVSAPPPSDPEEPVLADPELRAPRSGRRGRVRIRVRCEAACSGTVKLTVSRRMARRLRLGRSRVVARKRVRLEEAGSKRVTVRLGRKARRGMRRAGVRRVKVRLVASVRDAGDRRDRVRRTVRIRR